VSRTSSPQSSGGAGLIVINGQVLTADRRRPRAEAVAIRGTKVVAVGSNDEARRAVPGAEIIDADRRTVLPGLIDAHNHFLATGESLASIDVRYPAVASVADLVDVIAAAASAGTGGYLRAYGFDHAKYERAPTRWDLDSAAPGTPVLVGHVSGHYLLASSLAMQRRGVTEATPDPPGGRIDRDERGQPTGLFRDAAMALVQPTAVDIGHHGPNFHVAADPAELVAAIERAGAAYLAAGLTTVCDAQVTSRELTAYREARDQGRLRVRTVCMPLSHQLGEYRATGLAGPFGDEWLSVGPMKFYCDGSLIGGTAAFSSDAAARSRATGAGHNGRDGVGEPDGAGAGLFFWDPGAFAAAIEQAHLAGWQLGVHAQGDAAIGLVLDAFAAAQRARPAADPRFRIEHCGYPADRHLARMRDLGVIAVCQPRYLYDSGDEFLDKMPGIAHGLQPLRAELELGIRVVLSSDSDVASYRPLDTIAAAVSRQTRSGRPIGPDQALTLEEAVRAHTIEAAYALRSEHRIGSLEPGKLADLVILGGDLLACKPEQISGLGVDLTMIGGRVVFPPALRTGLTARRSTRHPAPIRRLAGTCRSRHGGFRRTQRSLHTADHISPAGSQLGLRTISTEPQRRCRDR
jgi:predicted amidohydrolase YtcJ